ncbi:myosin light chain kinase 3 isoform X2 [Kryptolebias marmoratus]|uniref:myosin light chain kinase 3 isoform X2 n=1 Tax=Kryptolebias marmoratus TaxID=37003 RepID=UPI0018ACBAB4|nr:myosin light chain kinase 3 isoform X2 [Kryptolebias marmoratus]
MVRAGRKESIQHKDLNTTEEDQKTWEANSITPGRDMRGKEKILVIANVPNYQGSDKRTPCKEAVSGKKKGKAMPPPIPMSPIVEKMAGLKAIRNRSNSLRLGRLAFYRHLEKVETMRCFWELKHVELEGGKQQVPWREVGTELKPNHWTSLSGAQLFNQKQAVNSWRLRQPGADYRSRKHPIMENFLLDKDMWIIGSVCLVATFLWQRFSSKKRGRPTVSSDTQAKDDKDKTKQNLKGGKAQKKQKPQDSSDGSCLNESALQKQVEKLNRENSEHYQVNTDADVQSAEDAGSKGRRQEPAELILQGSDTPAGQAEDTEGREDDGEDDGEDVFDDTDEEEEEQQAEDVTEQKEEEGIKKQLTEEEEEPSESGKDMGSQESSEDAGAASKRCVTEEDLVKDDLKKSRVEDRKQDSAERHTGEASKSDQTKAEAEEPAVKEFMIESSPPPSAPFDHRIVTPKPHQIATYYTINRDEVLGGGRFGQVYKCLEKSSGLTLAAKIIKARNQKEKEVVRNEIQVMNQLNHANLIQLYAAFESRNDIVLVMEYVEGGELFDRIIDENYNLTELDTVLFIRQICEGLQYMHKNYILHLDLKPENILCVSRATNKIKIIDFGLARRYKPREKLRVNFGTPEFLAPEVINYEFVSFPTDMWSLGVITYMLLSGLSPFLGDDDNETLNNILSCQWNFEEEEFADISDEAKDFITRLLVKSKSWRMSATESLRHGWLSDQNLHYRLHQKKNKCHSSRVPPPES